MMQGPGQAGPPGGGAPGGAQNPQAAAMMQKLAEAIKAKMAGGGGAPGGAPGGGPPPPPQGMPPAAPGQPPQPGMDMNKESILKIILQLLQKAMFLSDISQEDAEKLAQVQQFIAVMLQGGDQPMPGQGMPMEPQNTSVAMPPPAGGGQPGGADMGGDMAGPGMGGGMAGPGQGGF